MQSPTTNRFFFAILMMGATVGSAHSACVDEKIAVRGDFGSAVFSIEIADDKQERAVGLMNRSSMASLAGMLFVYDAPGQLTFWMRNTLIPLDMIFIKPNGTIAHIHENAQPLDETPVSGGPGNLAVLELNGGMSRRLGLAAGDVVQHRAFADTNPLWPCD